jgi:hypothetical protein
MRFVTISHPDLGVTSVPESRVAHLSEGWTVVEKQPDTDPAVDDEPVYTPAKKRASRARTSRKES